MAIPLLVPLAIAAASAIPKVIKNIKTAKDAKKAAKAIQVNDPTYTTDEYGKYAQQNLANYQNAYNTGMLPGDALKQQQIIDSAAGTRQNVGRNATSAAQRLALSGSIQGQQDQSMRQLGADTSQQKMGLLGGLSGALQGMTEQDKMVFMDRLRKAQEAQGAKNKLMQTAYDSSMNTFDTIQNFGSMAASGMFGDIGGGLGGLFQGKAAKEQNRLMGIDMQRQGGVPPIVSDRPIVGMGGVGVGNRPNTGGFNFGNFNAYPQTTNWFNQQYQQAQQRR
jgi:hypothetical protein